MAKLGSLDKAIASLEYDIRVLQTALDKLKAQQRTEPTPRIVKPRAVKGEPA